MAGIPRNDSFTALLRTLNEEQRTAVENIEGPVMVVAGPGTGKTHLMAARVGKILMETDTSPQSILCLTFTDAAVSALRTRLWHMIGPEAYRVPINTFHSFCHRIIQENPEYFGVAELEPASELERLEIVRQILAQLPPEHLLRQGYKDPFFYERHLRRLFTIMKTENWTPGQVRRHADRFIKSLPQHPDYIYQRNTKSAHKGEPKKEKIEETTRRMERLKAAADLYPAYLHALERLRRYEFEDMILWVLRAFQKHEALLRNYQERYLYVQVDEFQDTNGAQYDLLNELLQYWPTPNILIVGDDDQSIYEFQGARLDHLRDFQQRYRKGLTTVVLRQNYRSTQDILDTAARLIARNTLRATQPDGHPFDKHLRATAEGRGSVVLYQYETRADEIADVANRIEQLLTEGVPPREIAVIYAQHRQAEALQTLLARRNIPHQAKRPIDVLSLPLIAQVCELLHYLADEAEEPYRGEHRLFRLLHAPFWRIHPADLVTMAATLRLSAEMSAMLTWRALLTSPEHWQRLPLRNPSAFEPIGQQLDHWVAAVYNEPLPQLLERLYAQTGLLSWATSQRDRWTPLQALKTLLDFAASEALRQQETLLATTETKPLPLRHFLQQLQSMTANRLPLPLHQPAHPGPAVQLLTAHAAKGLEFEHVFLIDCVEDFWEKKNGGVRNTFALPPELRPAAEADGLEAQRRLFYVAMTRAKRALYLSYARSTDDGKLLMPSQFLVETELEAQPRPMAPEERLDTLAQLLQASEASPLPLPETNVWEALLADFSLSITALNRYLRCPRAFYFEDVLKIPAATSEAAAFGLAMHRTLQRFFAQDKAGRSAATLLHLFRAEMEYLRHYFNPAAFQQRVALGNEALQHLWEEIPRWPQRAVVERRLDRVHLNGVPLSGVIDRIEWLPNGSLAIVDFKTGIPDLSKTASPAEQPPYGGEYWRQMAFYHVLVENARLFLEPVRQTVIQWLEFDRHRKLPRVRVDVDSEGLRLMEQLISQTWENIRAARFEPGCQRGDCPWCRLYDGQATVLEGFSREEDISLDDSA